MPHIVLKIASGQSASAKQRIAGALTEALTSTLGCDEKFVSIAIEDIVAENWMDQVYHPEIIGKLDTVVKQPGYEAPV